VKISEKMLEDWICNNIEKVFPYDEDIKFIARQVPLEHGRLDIMAFSAWVIPIELKVRPLAEKDIGQILRYAYDIENELWRIGYYARPFQDRKALTLREHLLRNSWYEFHGMQDGQPVRAIQPVLIGTECDASTLAAAQAAKVDVKYWSYEDGNFQFESPTLLHLFPDHDDPCPNWLDEIHHYISDYCKQDAEVLFKDVINKLFGVEFIYD
jgi:hypothetical protein